MTLIEVLIAAAMMGVIALLLGDLMLQGQRGQNSLRLGNDFNSLTELLQLTMQNPVACTPNLVGKTFNTAALPSAVIPVSPVLYPSGQIMIATGQPYATGLNITKIELDKFQQISAGTNYIAMLHVEGTKASGSFLGAPVLSSDTPISLTTTLVAGTTAKIVSCGAQSANSVRTWTYNDGVTSGSFQIFSSAGSGSIQEFGVGTGVTLVTLNPRVFTLQLPPDSSGNAVVWNSIATTASVSTLDEMNDHQGYTITTSTNVITLGADASGFPFRNPNSDVLSWISVISRHVP